MLCAGAVGGCEHFFKFGGHYRRYRRSRIALVLSSKQLLEICPCHLERRLKASWYNRPRPWLSAWIFKEAFVPVVIMIIIIIIIDSISNVQRLDFITILTMNFFEEPGFLIQSCPQNGWLSMSRPPAGLSQCTGLMCSKRYKVPLKHRCSAISNNSGGAMRCRSRLCWQDRKRTYQCGAPGR